MMMMMMMITKSAVIRRVVTSQNGQVGYRPTLAAGAQHWTPLGELTAFPRLLLELRRTGGKKKEVGRRKGRKAHGKEREGMT